MDYSKIEFKGEKKFLSNMYLCDIVFSGSLALQNAFPSVVFDGQIYKSSEHLYQSLKSDSPLWKKIVQSTPYPEKTKIYARKHLKHNILLDTHKYFAIRSDWNSFKLEAMAVVLILKFSQNKNLFKKLQSMSGYIEERNCWKDTFWGTVDGEGENYLGRLLVLVRDEASLEEISAFVWRYIHYEAQKV